MKSIFILILFFCFAGCSNHIPDNIYKYLYFKIEESSNRYVGHYRETVFILPIDKLRNKKFTPYKDEESLYLNLFKSGAVPVSYDFYNANNCCKHGDLDLYYSQLHLGSTQDRGSDSILNKINNTESYHVLTLNNENLFYTISVCGMDLEYCMCYSKLERSEIDRDENKFAYINKITSISNPNEYDLEILKNYIQKVIEE